LVVRRLQAQVPINRRSPATGQPSMALLQRGFSDPYFWKTDYQRTNAKNQRGTTSHVRRGRGGSNPDSSVESMATGGLPPTPCQRHRTTWTSISQHR
jgi:hypothetical protein